MLMENATQHSFRFFMPSAELTKAIIAQNQRLLSGYVQRNFPVNEEEGQVDDEGLSLIARMLPRRLRAKASANSDRQIEHGQRLISERLYHYLSSLSESPWAKEGNTFPLREYVPDGMANMLGLSAYRNMPPDSPEAREITRLLSALTDEFRDWLSAKEHSSFVTPWLEIHLNEHEEIRLLAREEEIPEPGQQRIVLTDLDIPAARAEQVIEILANGAPDGMIEAGNGHLVSWSNGGPARSSLRQDAETVRTAEQRPQVKASTG
jgi:hypothetical protein